MSLGRMGGWSDRRPGAPPRALVERGVVASCDGIAYEGRDCLSKLRDAFPRPRARDDRLVRVESQRRRERPLPAPALALRKLVALREGRKHAGLAAGTARRGAGRRPAPPRPRARLPPPRAHRHRDKRLAAT